MGKGHTIHSSGQIEWHKNLVDDKSVKVGAMECNTNLDCYAFPLKCTGGLMYLSILGKPTDEELVKYPSVHLTSIVSMNGTLHSLTTVILNVMGNQSGLLIHNI